MARGISKSDVIPYILESDRGLDKKEQTIFYVRPKRGHESNVQTKMYMKAINEKADGTRDLDVKKTDAADIANFKVTIEKVENYAFPQGYYEEREALKKDAVKRTLKDDMGNEEEVYFSKEVTDGVMLEKIARTLPSSALREITQVSEDISRLKEGEKKD